MWKFNNNGTTINGVPERDLTAEEFDALDVWLKDVVSRSAAYTFVESVPEQAKSEPVANSSPKPKKGGVADKSG
jgi:hypothetical protein